MVARPESAIAPHLRQERTNPQRMRSADYMPEFESFTSRLAADVRQLTIGYFGVQSQTPELTAPAWRELEDLLHEADGPRLRDRARYVDQFGFSTRIVIAYWDDNETFDRWFAASGYSWTAPARSAQGLGFFSEIVRPTVDRLETIFTSQVRKEGLARFADSMEPFVEHGYWGSMRDRLPITQTDPVEADGLPRAEDRGGVVTVVPQHNLCLIRSGQDFGDTRAEERAFYLNDIEPTLRAGMDFLRDKGSEVGCFSNRYMDVVDVDDNFLEKRFAMSWWNDMEDLEAWSKSHPTHARIFDAAMRHISEFGTKADLHLYHEVIVADRSQQFFEYLDCHRGTGLLTKLSRH